MTSYDVTWRHLGTCQITTCQIRSSKNQPFHICTIFFMICRKFNVLAFIWWVKHQNWTTFDEVIGFCFYYEISLILTDFCGFWFKICWRHHFFWIFFMFSLSTYENEHFCQKLWKLHFSFRKYEGSANLHYPPPPQDGGFMFLRYIFGFE